jgi:hypothetical protein
MNGSGMHVCVPLRPAGKRLLLVAETSAGGITPLLPTLLPAMPNPNNNTLDKYLFICLLHKNVLYLILILKLFQEENKLRDIELNKNLPLNDNFLSQVQVE